MLDGIVRAVDPILCQREHFAVGVVEDQGVDVETLEMGELAGLAQRWNRRVPRQIQVGEQAEKRERVALAAEGCEVKRRRRR